MEIDLVLCDLGLPGINRCEVAEASKPKLLKTRLVAVSGHTQPGDVKRSADAGFKLHIAKPADPVRVEKLLVELSGRSSEASDRFELQS